jgi:hypothetical protein
VLEITGLSLLKFIMQKMGINEEYFTILFLADAFTK